jgi:transmembrane sensor
MQIEPKSRPSDQALRWFVLLRSGDATESDWARFQSWLEAKESHRHELRKLQRVWMDLDKVKPLLRDQLRQTVTAPSAAPTWPQPFRSATRRWTGVWDSPALAASLLLLIAGIWWASVSTVMEYRTAKGEQRTIQLPDGSTLRLNTDTSVRTELSFLRRTVILEKGEVFFVVSHEKRRPFDVRVGHGTVRDIGTRFIVRKQDEKVTVTVVEGSVEVRTSSLLSGLESRQVLRAGEQLSYAQNAVSPVTMPSLATSMAWLEGKIMFEARPLAELIQEISRYQEGEIQILDPDLTYRQVSGAFGIHDQDSFLKALGRAVPVKISRVNKHLVILEAADE